jgi:hypothetical protein
MFWVHLELNRNNSIFDGSFSHTIFDNMEWNGVLAPARAKTINKRDAEI